MDMKLCTPASQPPVKGARGNTVPYEGGEHRTDGDGAGQLKEEGFEEGFHRRSTPYSTATSAT